MIQDLEENIKKMIDSVDGGDIHIHKNKQKYTFDSMIVGYQKVRKEYL